MDDAAPLLTPRKARVIFRPFRRLDNSVTAPAGTGIGLTIARRLARSHGGDVRWVGERRDDAAAGNRFELRFRPLEKASS